MEFLFEFLVVSGVGYLIKEGINHRKEHALFKEVLGDILRDRMLDIHGKAVKYGEIRQNKKKVFYKMFESYTKLGLNGFVEDLKRDIDEM